MHLQSLLEEDSQFIGYLRGFAILAIVFGHVGGFWVYPPYSEFLHTFVPLFFFLSGSVLVHSYYNYTNIYEYYLKRITSLYIPYIMMCIIAIFVFFIINNKLPDFNFANLLLWIQIRPTEKIMPFPLGQIWFLHTLLAIILLSPGYFYLFKERLPILLLVVFAFLIICSAKLIYPIDKYFTLFGNNFYKPIIHSIFFISGMLYFSCQHLTTAMHNIFIAFFCFGLSIIISFASNIHIGYSEHIYAPDLYYVAGSFGTIFIFLALKNVFMKIVNSNRISIYLFDFFFKHTFSIFLLHTFAIYLSERLPYFANPGQKSIAYGISKFVVVLALTCLLAIPYSHIASGISSYFLKNIKKPCSTSLAQ